MNTKTIVCQECGKEKDIYIGEYNRKIKRGTGFFCSRSCSSSYWMKDPESSKSKKEYNNSPKNKEVLARNRQIMSETRAANPFNYFVAIARKRKKINFDLTSEYLKKLWESQNGKCKFTGTELHLPLGTKGFPTTRPFFGASLDRIDSNLGYTQGNVQFICVGLNYMKNDYLEQDFLDGFDKIVRNYILLKYNVTL
jgi:hypothetical protein